MTVVDDTSLREQNIALVRRHLEAINTWDFEVMEEELFHPEISYVLPCVPPPFPKLTEGLAAVMEFNRGIDSFAIEENLSDIRIDTLAGDANELVAEYVSDMKLSTGRPYRNSYVVRVTVRDGRIYRFVEMFDANLLIEAMGGIVTIPELP